MTGKTEKRLRFPLWGKFAAGALLLECMLLCAIAPVVEGQIRKSVLEELLKRGIGVAENMASVNAGAVAAGDAEKIERNVAEALESDHLSYAAVLIDGHVAGYAGPSDPSDIKAHLLGSPEAERAAKIEQPRIRYKSYTLKSSSASLGARRFSGLLFQLETAACAEDRRRTRLAWEAVDIEYQSVAGALQTKIDMQSS